MVKIFVILSVVLFAGIVFYVWFLRNTPKETDKPLKTTNKIIHHTTGKFPKPDKLVVIKCERKLQLWKKDTLLKTYEISLGANPLGPKSCQGDNRTPEGTYYIDSKNPNSQFHKNLGVSYPNDEDRKNATRMGKPTGGDIKIHGLKNTRPNIGKAHLQKDWTAGCMALTNDEIEEIYDLVDVGTPIEIRP